VRSFIVVNPAAGRGRARRVWERVRPHLDRFGRWSGAVTEYPGHARELARAAAADGYARVVALGGDGTVSEVVDGLAWSGSALGVIPAGSGNDFGRSAGVPRDAVAAARLALTGPVRSIDLGEIRSGGRSRHFVNVAGFGFDAEVARTANALPKRFGGTLTYVLAVLRALRRCRPVAVRLELDGRPLERELLLAAVANGPACGGGMLIAPNARNDDGLFDVCLAGDLSRAELVRLLPKMYSGGHAGHPKVEFHRCRELRAQAGAPVGCQADGELTGDLPATFVLHPGGIPCVTPEPGRS
jgi:YegS/Rv2252/BmrU family lipid kinase